MKPRGMLMIEHRLIEKMLAKTKGEAGRIEKTGNADPVFIETVVDFVRVYADRTHHGKEEEILFKELEMKDLSAEDRKELAELVDEHRRSREQVRKLSEAGRLYKAGDRDKAKEIADILQWLADFYPIHIAKEDKVFFPQTEKYFNDGELQKLLDEFDDFDRKMIHEKYQTVVNSIAE